MEQVIEIRNVSKMIRGKKILKGKAMIHIDTIVLFNPLNRSFTKRMYIYIDMIVEETSFFISFIWA